MPVRLNVIMIESAPAAGSARRLAEAVVGELIGVPGVDLTLVDSLDNLDATSTDKLTLDGITGDVCVLDWQSPGTIAASLQSIGFTGRRSPHPHDLEAGNLSTPQREGSMRRIYAFDLHRFSEASQICEALSAVRATRQVRTFSLAAPQVNQRPDIGKSPRDAGGAVPRPIPPAVESPKTPALPTSALPTSQGSQSPSLAEKPSRSSRPNSLDLDDLVDQLDRFDS